ncbi:zinc finger protein [Macleaya cordata]|uniref:RING-type E3 ubiquitin transferase n=1 Tax=Macleaya cordata TaxID=56857 RepID=A0A200QLB6_MACCD|nr:zinc finger protein [Macleaya cordata]
MEVASLESISQEDERDNNNNNNNNNISASSQSNNNKNNSNINAVCSIYKDEEDEEEFCRICRNPGDSENPLRYPCACKGSMKFVHQDCLLQWLKFNHKNARHCEVCRHAFSFSPVYAENAPTRLRFAEFVVGFVTKACHVLQFFVRLAFVLFFWLLIVPFVSMWAWRLSFVRSLGEAERLFLSHHISATAILTDSFRGFLLHVSTGFIALGATSLWVYFRHLREPGGQDAVREDEGDGYGARAARGPLAPANRIHAVGGNGGAGQGVVGADQRNAENVALRLEMLAARLEAHIEQMVDGLDGAAIAELVLSHLIGNTLFALAVNIIYIGVLFFVPFSLGRIILHYISWFFCTATSSMLSTSMPFTASDLYLANISLKNAFSSVTNWSSEIQKDGLLSQGVEVVAETLIANTTGLEEASNGVGKPLSVNLSSCLSDSDATNLATGYMLIVSLVVLYLGVVALIRHIRGKALIVGILYGIASIAEAIPSLISQFLTAMRHFMTMMKVAFLLVIELGIFPLMCGWWLDVCTIKMLGKTISQRVEFFSNSPLASFLIHWMVGVLHMLQISIFISLLQEAFHNGILYFHARSFLWSIAGNGLLTVLLVFLPVKLAMRLAPSIFPLDISASDPFTEIPTAMLLLQICLPFAFEHFKLRATIKALLCRWFTAVGWVLGLTDFLLPRTDIGGQENMNEERRQDRQLDVQRGGDWQQDQAPIALIVAGDPNRNIRTSGNFDVVEEYDDHETDSEYSFVFRIVLLLVLTWMALLLFNSALIVVPISLGRALFNSIPLLPITRGIKCNDLYAFIIGSYTIWTFLAGVRYFMEHIKKGRAQILEFGQILKWFGIVLKSSALLLIWILVIPVLIGLLFELLVIVPMRVPVDESPAFLLYQDWALGLFFLNLWTRLVMLNPRMALVDESWQIKFQRVREDSFSPLQVLWVLQEIVLPIIMKLLTVLCVPYVFARGMLPALGYPLIVNSAIYRFAWVCCLTITLLCSCSKRFNVWFTNLHNSIRDDRYVIGRRLHNFSEVRFARRNDSVAETISESQDDANLQDAAVLIQPEQEGNIGARHETC